MLKKNQFDVLCNVAECDLLVDAESVQWATEMINSAVLFLVSALI